MRLGSMLALGEEGTMRLLKSASAAIFAFWLVGAVADAATLSNTQVGNWFVGSYSDDQTGVFSHCAASTTYNSGIALLFSVNRNYNWNMGFESPNWKLQIQQNYPISFTVDNVPALSATAIAVGAMGVAVPLADSTALFGIFRRGKLLTVFGAGQVLQFALTDTSKVLPALGRVVS